MSIIGVPYNKNNECYTPKYIVDMFGQFDYDPATCIQKANEFGIDNYDTIETDGLSKDWTKYKRIWINPPFTIKHEFLSKAVETYNKVKNDIYILFPIDFLTTKIFNSINSKGKLFIPNGRIVFELNNGKKSSPAFGSVIYKLQDTNEIEYIRLNHNGDK